MKNGIFVFNELCVRFFGRPVRDYVRGATSRIMKFDAKDKINNTQCLWVWYWTVFEFGIGPLDTESQSQMPDPEPHL